MDFAKLGRLGRTAAKAKPEAGVVVTGIVKVTEDGYHPAKLTVRATLGPRMFTAEFLSDDLPAIEGDPRVERVSLAEAMPLQKLP